MGLFLRQSILLLWWGSCIQGLPVLIPHAGDGPDALDVQDDQKPDFNVPDQRHPDALHAPQPGEEIAEPVRVVQHGAEALDQEPVLHDVRGVVNMHQVAPVVGGPPGVIQDNNLQAPDSVDGRPPEPHDDNLQPPDVLDQQPGKHKDDVIAPDVNDDADEYGAGGGEPAPVVGNRAARLDIHANDVQAPDALVADPVPNDNLEPPDALVAELKPNDNLDPPDVDVVAVGDAGRGEEALLHPHDIGTNDINELQRMEEEAEGKLGDAKEETGDDHLRFLAHLDKDAFVSKHMNFNDVKPPDHLDAVHLEVDGHLNHDYKKEIFFGNHEDFDMSDEKELSNILIDVFHKADLNMDNFLTQEEIADWIQLKVEEHFTDSDTENDEHVFNALDRDKDGFITWREFHVEYLIARGNEEQKAVKHADDYDTIDLELEEKEHLIRFKFRWADADEDPQDNKISPNEFHFFRHPEQSPKTLQRLVEEIMENIDLNRDYVLTEDEFAALPEGDVEDDWQPIDKAWQEERRKEFKHVIDRNHDGNVTEDELKFYVDPRNPKHAISEAKILIDQADSNHDYKLSIKEVLKNKELFIGSKVVDTSRIFHDEF